MRQNQRIIPPNIVYVSGTRQYSMLENPARPLLSPAVESRKDAAWFRNYLKIVIPNIDSAGIMPPNPTGRLYEGTPENPALQTKMLGVFPTITSLMEALQAKPPRIQNAMDAVVIHSDYLAELWDNHPHNPQEKDNAFTCILAFMEENPVIILNASRTAKLNASVENTRTELLARIKNADMGANVRLYEVQATKPFPNNPEAEWGMLPPHTVAQNFYDALELFLSAPPEESDPVLAFRGVLETRADPELASIQDEAYPDATYIDGSPYIGRVVTVTSKKGGTGKTTTSLGLAHALTVWGKEAVAHGYADHALKVIVVDLDLQDGQVGFNTSDQSTTITGIFNDFSAKYITLGEDKHQDWEIIRKHIINNERTGYATLLAPEDPRDLAVMNPHFYRAVISTLREHFDVIIIDTSVQLDSPYMTQCAYPLSRTLYYVAEPYPIPLDTMKRQFTYGLGSARNGGGGMVSQRISIFVNKVEPEHVVAKGSALPFWDVQNYSVGGIPVLTGVPYLHEAALDAVNVGLPGGFNYLLNNKGYSEGMSLIAYDIIRGTDYQLFSPEQTAELEEYFEAAGL